LAGLLILLSTHTTAFLADSFTITEKIISFLQDYIRPPPERMTNQAVDTAWQPK
jgi:hypothetical protein